MPTIGIDLGTTNSLVAYWSEDGPKIIPNILGSNLTPSVVSIDENGEILIGEVAKERLITHPQLTASCFKRYMGTDKKYKLGKKTFTPEELSSFVLKSIKADAEAHLGQEVEKAIISVPAYFNDKQRNATKRAAEMAGISVERLINEPTAAAIAYGLHQEESETKFMIFDLGGGTFDISILELFEGVMEVRAISGDNFLGGEDFTNMLVSDFLEKEAIDIDSLNLKEKSAIYKQAEICKRMLSNNNEGAMVFHFKDKEYKKRITREDYEKIINQLIFRLRYPIERAIKDALLKPGDIDAVVLIGGATRMPIVKSVVGRMFGKLPYCNINPDETVAIGAAIQVALKEKNQSLNEIILTDVCPYTLGTEVVKHLAKDTYDNGYFLPIIERNTPIPVSRMEVLSTIADNQTSINLKVYQGENRRVNENVKIGQINITLPPAPAGEEKIEVRYTYDINGILEVEVKTLSTGEVKSVIIENNKGSMTEQEIKERLEQLKDIKIHPREKLENKLLVAKGERLYEESLGDTREYIGELLKNFDYILSRQNELEIKKESKILKKQLEELDGKEGWFDY